MLQSANTAIVLRHANYREYDRMLTLLSPTRGKMTVLCRGCRRPRSPLLNAAELFALGDFELYERGDHLTLTAATLIETFHPLREDYDRLTCGTYLLNLAEIAAQPMQNAQELFMLLLHTLSRLTFTDQPWKPLLSGFLLHYAAVLGEKPRLNHCVLCRKPLPDTERLFFDGQSGGVCCEACLGPGVRALSPQERNWMRRALTVGSAGWVDTPEGSAPFSLLKAYVESRLDQPVRTGKLLPQE